MLCTLLSANIATAQTKESAKQFIEETLLSCTTGNNAISKVAVKEHILGVMLSSSSNMHVIDLANSRTSEFEGQSGLIFYCNKPGCVSYVIGGNVANATRSNQAFFSCGGDMGTTGTTPGFGARLRRAIDFYRSFLTKYQSDF